jgi:hypothetical protein
METKVDIQKLQLLNDRLTQTIDALNQVRMLAHGIQHTAASPWGYSAFGAPFGVAPQYWPYAQQFGVSPYSVSPWQVPFASPFVGGIQHTSSPWGTSPYLGGYQTTPFAQSPYFTGIQHTSPFSQSPYISAFQQTSPFVAAFQQSTPTFSGSPYVGNGISHSSWDPSWQMRSQTMPWT